MAKICIDAGHYGKYNRSPGIPEYYESDMVWKLHLLLKAELESYGHTVITTRKDKDKDLSLYNRGAASKGCDLFLSLHSNAVDSRMHEDIDYPVVHVQLDGRGDKLGTALAKLIERLMGTRQAGYSNTRKGSAGGEYYGVLYGAAAVGTVGMIIEHSFHTCSKSVRWLLEDSNLEKLAKEEAKLISEYYGTEVKPEEEEQNTETEYKPTVLEWQKAAIADGFNFPKYGADGIWGDECRGVATKALVMDLGNGVYLNKNLTKIVQKVVGVTADGLCGPQTHKAICDYQRKNGLSADGCVGVNTWSEILGV